jgi:ADP-ribose pyrophosphatase YjhB (NUDIX family)
MSSIVPVPAVNGIIFNSEGKCLLTRRSPMVREPGKWCLPGGHLDGGEDWLTAVKREIHEEISLKVESARLVGIYSNPSLTISKEILPEGYRKQFVVASFLIDKFEGEVLPNEEVDAWDWFALEALPDPMIPSHPVRIQDAYLYKGEVFVR